MVHTAIYAVLAQLPLAAVVAHNATAALLLAALATLNYRINASSVMAGSPPIKSLDLETMQLTTFHDFGNYGGSLTWAVIHNGNWWCNFARYGADNAQTFLVEFDAEWKELRRWTYPSELIRKLAI